VQDVDGVGRAPMIGRRRIRPQLAALVFVTGIGPLATDTYLPAMPAMARALGGSAALVQLTITTYIIGLALGQLLAGPLSDGAGRRPYLLGGTAGFAVTSAACALAPSVGLLVAVRLLHGALAGFGIACGRAVISDTARGVEAAQKYGTLASITMLGPVIAPGLGAGILSRGDWRLVFWVLTGLGVAMVVAVLLGIPETLPPSERHGGGMAATGARILELLRLRPFLVHVVLASLTTSGFFVYIGGSSFVLQQVYGISQTTYALVFTVNALALVSASVAFRLLVARVSIVRLRDAGVGLTAVAAVLLLAVALAGRDRVGSIAVPWVLLSCVAAGIGLLNPPTMALAQEAGHAARGTASALVGGGSFLVGALVTPLTGLVGNHSMLPMAGFMALFLCLAVAWLVATRSWTAVEGPADPAADPTR